MLEAALECAGLLAQPGLPRSARHPPSGLETVSKAPLAYPASPKLNTRVGRSCPFSIRPRATRWQIAPPHQHGLAAQEAGCLLPADPEDGEIGERGLDRPQQAERGTRTGIGIRCGAQVVHGDGLGEGAHARAPERDDVAAATQRAADVAG
jgi:hypothetical protein